MENDGTWIREDEVKPPNESEGTWTREDEYEASAGSGGDMNVAFSQKNINPNDIIQTDIGKTYRVIERLKYADWKSEVDSGEAKLYLCHPADENEAPYKAYTETARISAGDPNTRLPDGCKKPYVVKIYKKAANIRPDIIKQLAELDSQYIAKILYTGRVKGGVFNEHRFEIYDYYRAGNLKDYKFRDLEDYYYLVRCINEGLYILHKYVLHKDIKPANILICDDFKTPAITDFGISSEKLADIKEYKTHIELTRDYAAPEVNQNTPHTTELADYYSLGITLYELWFGATPARKRIMDNSADLSINTIYYPDEPIPGQLKILINALTFEGKGEEYLEKRWGYDMVKRWCERDETLADPTEVIMENLPVTPLRNFNREWNGNIYRSVEELMLAFASNWRAAMRTLYTYETSQKLANYISHYDEKTSEIIVEAYAKHQNEVNNEQKRYIQNIELWKLIYHVCTDLKKFYWESSCFDSFGHFIRELYLNINIDRKSENENEKMWTYYFDQIVRGKILSEYLKHLNIDKIDEKMFIKVQNIEKEFEHPISKDERIVLSWKLSYINEVALGNGIPDFRWSMFKSPLGFFADSLANELKNKDTLWKPELDLILRKKLLTYYLSEVYPNADESIFRRVNELETRYATNYSKYNEYERESVYWRAIYILCTKSDLQFYWYGRTYFDMHDLAMHMLSCYNRHDKNMEGMVKANALSAYLSYRLAETDVIPGFVKIIEEQEYVPNATLWKLAYQIDSAIPKFYWANDKEGFEEGFGDLKAFGRKMKEMLADFSHKKDRRGYDVFSAYSRDLSDMVKNGILSEYLRYINAEQDFLKTIEKLEEKFCGGDEYVQEYVLHEIAYALSGDNSFYFDGIYFDDIDALVQHLADTLKSHKKTKNQKKSRESKQANDANNLKNFKIPKTPKELFEAFGELINKLVSQDGDKASASLAAWLICTGMPEKLELLEKNLFSKSEKQKEIRK